MTHPLTRTLTRARAAWRVSDGVRAVAAWLAPALGALLVLFLLDNLLHLPGWLRLGLGVAWLLAAAAAFARRTLPHLVRRRSWQATARMLEERLAVPGNALINALQLVHEARSNGAEVPEAALAEVSQRADRAAAHVDVGKLYKLRPVVRALRIAGVVLAAALVYVALFGDYAANAVARYGDPLGDVPPVTNVRLEVEPGDAEVVAGAVLEIGARVRVRSGEVPATAVLRVRGRGEPWEARSMTPASGDAKERRFEAAVGPLRADCEYQVASGDAVGRVWHVRVVQPPAITAARLVLTPPAYTGAEPVETADPVVVRALTGTHAVLSFAVDRAPVLLTLRLPGGKALERRVTGSDRRASFDFDVDTAGSLALEILDRTRDEAAHAFQAWSAPVTVLDDAAPRVTLTAEAPAQIVPPGTDLPLTARAEDDFGLAGLRFVVQRVSTAVETDLKTWRYPRPGERRVTERLVVPLDPAAFVPGETYRFLAEAGDYHPDPEQVVRSQDVVVRIARVRELAVDPGSALASPFEALRRLAERQRAAVGQTGGLLELVEEHVAKGRYGARAAEMARGQAAIREDAVALAKAFAQADGGASCAEALLHLDRQQYAALAQALEPVAPAAARAVVTRSLEAALPLQREALAVLEALLGRIALDTAKGADEKLAVEDEEGARDLEKTLDAKAEMLKEFLDEQRRLVELSRELEKKNPEDWTEEDEKLLGRLEAQELTWAKFFEEAFTDLSKVPDQDFANSDLLDEFNSVYMEIKKAADALGEHKVEIAVPLEQSGLELAEKLESNLERWIPDTPDHTKWEMEEPEGDFDVPLADLPDELEDIVGDLIDDADAMDEDVEDVSSSWMDSLDKGAGWDATDGPISNMSAKGITGNRLPNTNEIGGRSGEGRSGKSHGQFVEKTAEGKGGRETPTRLTEDPFESGSVKDRSNEATGGATGGGKLAGEGMEGLRGRVPPPVLAALQRLANHQGELAQRAERLAGTVRKLGLPAGDVEDAAGLLAWSRNHLENAEGFDLRTAHANLKEALARARASLRYEADTLREHGADVPERVRDELMEGLGRAVPTGYEDILRAYYRAIAEGR